MKIKIIILSLFFTLTANLSQSFAALDGGSSLLSENSKTDNKSFSQNSLGAGLAIGFRFNLADDIFTDSEDKNSKSKDHIFTEIEAFGNQFFSGEIDQNFGGRLNFGYEINGIRIYGSGGLVASKMDYQEQGSSSQKVNSLAPFFGGGMGYDITKNISLKLDSIFYNFDFKPKNSEFRRVEVSVAAISLGLALHF